MDSKTEKKEIGIKCKTGGSTGDPGGHGERGLAQLCLPFNLQNPSLAWSHILWLPPYFPVPTLAHSLIVAVGSCEHPLGVHQDAPTLEFGVVVHGCHPGLRILLTGKSSDDPRLDGRCSTCSRAVRVGLA